MTQDGDQFEILADPAQVHAVAEAIEKAGIKVGQSEVRLIPDSYVPVTDKTVAKAVMKFVEALEDHDDVQDVYTNMDLDDAILAAIEKESA